MKHQWHTRRSFVKSSDSQARWDRAYQHLLQWSSPVAQPPLKSQDRLKLPEAPDGQEVTHACSGVCARLDTQSGANADH
jgi:hypothetical protein